MTTKAQVVSKNASAATKHVYHVMSVTMATLFPYHLFAAVGKCQSDVFKISAIDPIVRRNPK